MSLFAMYFFPDPFQCFRPRPRFRITMPEIRL